MVQKLVGVTPHHAVQDLGFHDGDPRSASASASSVSAFFSAFFRSCAAARSNGRGRHCIGIWVFLIQP